MFSHGVICIYAIYLCVQVYLTLCGSMDCRPHGLLCPWNFPGKNTGAGCHFLFESIFLTQGSNLHLLPSPALEVPKMIPSGKTWS